MTPGVFSHGLRKQVQHTGSRFFLRSRNCLPTTTAISDNPMIFAPAPNEFRETVIFIEKIFFIGKNNRRGREKNYNFFCTNDYHKCPPTFHITKTTRQLFTKGAILFRREQQWMASTDRSVSSTWNSRRELLMCPSCRTGPD